MRRILNVQMCSCNGRNSCTIAIYQYALMLGVRNAQERTACRWRGGSSRGGRGGQFACVHHENFECTWEAADKPQRQWRQRLPIAGQGKRGACSGTRLFLFCCCLFLLAHWAIISINSFVFIILYMYTYIYINRHINKLAGELPAAKYQGAARHLPINTLGASI